jgi:hypothetical protein
MEKVMRFIKVSVGGVAVFGPAIVCIRISDSLVEGVFLGITGLLAGITIAKYLDHIEFMKGA